MGRKRKPHYARKTLSVLMVTGACAFVLYSSVHLFAIDTVTASYATGITATSNTADTASSTTSGNTATSVSGTSATTTTNSGTSTSATTNSTSSATQVCPKTHCAAVSCHGKTPAKVYYATHT